MRVRVFWLPEIVCLIRAAIDAAVAGAGQVVQSQDNGRLSQLVSVSERAAVHLGVDSAGGGSQGGLRLRGG